MDGTRRAWLVDVASGNTFEIAVSGEDPWFSAMSVEPGSLADLTLQRGNLLNLGPESEEGPRPIVGVSVVSTPFGSYYEILAPQRSAPVSGPQKYVSFESRNEADPIPLRSGSRIVGGRRSGFFDTEGLILSAQYIGGSLERFEDWSYLVVSDKGDTANWVILDDINVPVAGPERVFEFPVVGQRDRGVEVIDMLIRTGERELIDYLSSNANRLKKLNGRQFENTAQSIYRNLGFTVEPMGNWNQADGGVDFIAVSKSLEGGEVRTAVQCKVSRNKISSRPIRELAGVLPRFKADQGVVVTTSLFTEPARAERDDWFANIELTDRVGLYDKVQQIMGNWGVDTTKDDRPLS